MKEIVTQTKTIQQYDALNNVYFDVVLPERITTIDEATLQWDNPSELMQKLLANTAHKIARQQFADAKKTAIYHLSPHETFMQYGFDDIVQWDNAFLDASGLVKPPINKIIPTATLYVSARPNYVNRIVLELMRLWCGNGAGTTLFKRVIDLNNIITVERPLDTAMTMLGEQLVSPKIIEAEILDEGIAVKKHIVGKAIQLFDNHIVGKDAQPLPTRILRDSFIPVINKPNWFNEQFKQQLIMIHDNMPSGRDVTMYDLSNAYTNVVNFGDSYKHADKYSAQQITLKQQSRAYLYSNMQPYIKAIGQYIAYQN